eukprot:12425964-Karenia_brevis.AAC.1
MAALRRLHVLGLANFHLHNGTLSVAQSSAIDIALNVAGLGTDCRYATRRAELRKLMRSAMSLKLDNGMWHANIIGVLLSHLGIDLDLGEWETLCANINGELSRATTSICEHPGKVRRLLPLTRYKLVAANMNYHQLPFDALVSIVEDKDAEIRKLRADISYLRTINHSHHPHHHHHHRHGPSS